jgi:hypothetical protein
MMVVQLEKPGNMTLARWFAELRSWFDENNCQPTLFSESGRIMDNLLFNVTFADNAQARLFSSTFTKYAPSIRRTTSGERTDLNKGQFSVEMPTSEGFDIGLVPHPRG